MKLVSYGHLNYKFVRLLPSPTGTMAILEHDGTNKIIFVNVTEVRPRLRGRLINRKTGKRLRPEDRCHICNRDKRSCRHKESKGG